MIQPIDGQYLTSLYFWGTTVMIAIILSAVGIYWNKKDEKTDRYIDGEPRHKGAYFI